jgi:hypothetical protein
MPQDSFPHPVSEPEAQGVPEYADDESTAYDTFPSVREADGPSPAPIPPDREDGPLGLDEYGLTADEELRGESLDDRLRREQPEVWASDRPLKAADLDGGPIEANPGSPVSVYDHVEEGEGTVGRLVQPDEGGAVDVESDEVAYDAGPAGGGASMEELAMHPIEEGAESSELDDLEYDNDPGAAYDRE